jgi:hypothetical protein
MQANFFDRMILGANTNGQGINAVVAGAHHVAALRKWALVSVRGLSLRLGAWYALSLKRVPATMTPATVTCRSSATRRDQRHMRWMSGVVVEPGTVGVC